MNRVTAKLLFFLVLILLISKTEFAYSYDATGSAVVSATVQSTTINPPILVIPSDNSTSNNARQPLVWKRPSPLPSTPLHHYDVYLDGQVLAASVSDSINTQTYYFYTISRIDDTFYLNMTADFAQGYHTWKVVVYDTSGTNASSETRTFYTDSIAPFITLSKVDRQTLNWTTLDYTTIPEVTGRDLEVTTPNPLLTGLVEPYANMQIILMCPQNIPHCQNQVWLGNYPTGIWQHRFYDLIKGLVYTVYISSTDAASNFTIFPEFYLAYGIVSPTTTPTATITPAVSPTPPYELSPTPEIEVIPTPFIPVPPVAPTPPIFLTATPMVKTNFLFYLLFALIVLGLPLHLLMTFYGSGTHFSHIIRFIYTLFFPFIGKKTNQTIPFTTIEMYDPNNLEKAWQTKISDIKGFFNLNEPLITKIFIKLSSLNRYWKNIIVNSQILPILCLYPNLDNHQMAQNRLRTSIMKYRLIPLILAIITSSYALVLSPNYFYLIYLYLSLQLVFSEYIYPKIK